MRAERSSDSAAEGNLSSPDDEGSTSSKAKKDRASQDKKHKTGNRRRAFDSNAGRRRRRRHHAGAGAGARYWKPRQWNHSRPRAARLDDRAHYHEQQAKRHADMAKSYRSRARTQRREDSRSTSFDRAGFARAAVREVERKWSSTAQAVRSRFGVSRTNWRARPIPSRIVSRKSFSPAPFWTLSYSERQAVLDRLAMQGKLRPNANRAAALPSLAKRYLNPTRHSFRRVAAKLTRSTRKAAKVPTLKTAKRIGTGRRRGGASAASPLRPFGPHNLALRARRRHGKMKLYPMRPPAVNKSEQDDWADVMAGRMSLASFLAKWGGRPSLNR